MDEKKRRRISYTLLLLGGLMIIAGIVRGEVAEVFLKATNICLECIGIG